MGTPCAAVRGGCWAAVVALVCSAVIAPSAGAKPKAIKPAAAFTLPSAKACVAGGELTLLLRRVSHVKWVGATVTVAGKRVKTVTAKQVTKPIRLTHLPAGKSLADIEASCSETPFPSLSADPGMCPYVTLVRPCC